jgi:hypothetical protein
MALIMIIPNSILKYNPFKETVDLVEKYTKQYGAYSLLLESLDHPSNAPQLAEALAGTGAVDQNDVDEDDRLFDSVIELLELIQSIPGEEEVSDYERGLSPYVFKACYKYVQKVAGARDKLESIDVDAYVIISRLTVLEEMKHPLSSTIPTPFEQRVEAITAAKRLFDRLEDHQKIQFEKILTLNEETDPVTQPAFHSLFLQIGYCVDGMSNFRQLMVRPLQSGITAFLGT